MIIIPVILVVMLTALTEDYKYVGVHHCEKSEHVYPAQVEGFKPYIIYQGKNTDGFWVVKCGKKAYVK